MINDVLVQLRKLARLTQEEVAERCNVSRQAVSKWEKGQTVPDIYNCQELCKLYHVSINELIEADAHDSKSINPVDKFLFGYTSVDENGCIHLPSNCLDTMKVNNGDRFIVLGDLKQGIALVPADTYEHFAKDILKAREAYFGGSDQDK